MRWPAALNTFFFVTLITVFVWVVAESQTLQQGDLSARIRLDVGSTNRAVRVAPEQRWDGRVRLEVEGPAAALDRVREALREPITLRTAELLPEAGATVSLALRDALARHPVFAGSGIQLLRAEPPTIRLQTDEVETRTLSVDAALEAGEPARPPTPEPAEVSVSAPALVWSRLPPRAIARVPAAATAAMTPGEASTVEGVRVELPRRRGVADDDVWGVTIEPPRVDVRVTLRGGTDELTLPELTIAIALPPDSIGQWDITVEGDRPVVSGVRVRGPAEAIDRIEADQVALEAVVSLEPGMLQPGMLRRPVRILGLPPGVGVVGDAPTVDLDISPVEVETPS